MVNGGLSVVARFVLARRTTLDVGRNAKWRSEGRLADALVLALRPDRMWDLKHVAQSLPFNYRGLIKLGEPVVLPALQNTVGVPEFGPPLRAFPDLDIPINQLLALWCLVQRVRDLVVRLRRLRYLARPGPGTLTSRISSARSGRCVETSVGGSTKRAFEVAPKFFQRPSTYSSSRRTDRQKMQRHPLAIAAVSLLSEVTRLRSATIGLSGACCTWRR